MNMAASTSSSEIPRKTYDVFISFRGEDTRFNFTSHLHSALKNKQIKTFFDEEDLSRGDEISPSLKKAIEESQLSIILFSKNYANSSWCLDELLHILWCKDNLQRQVIPVFYHVDPSDVRKQQGSYKEAFEDLQERFKITTDKLQNWRLAMDKAASLAGFSTQDIRFRSESKLIEAIVEDTIKKLNGSSSLFIGSENLVGIDKSVKRIEDLLQIGSSNVQSIGIWGRGGIGKTTLARFIFWKLFGEFEGCCFLENVREEWEKHREKHHLQIALFSNLLGEKDMNLITSFVIPAFVINRIKRMKSLIVLDDVNDEEQLEILIGSRQWFGDGSRIIVTSRDALCLRSHLVDAIYEVRGLNSDEASQLFCWNALRRNCVASFPTKVIENVVTYAEGIPLLLNVLRSLFNHNSRENWETLLDKLKNSRAGEKIQNALMLSYNDLSKRQKDVFLDIACFFKGRNRHEVERILEAGSFFADSTIDDLIDKSLITINHEAELCMHDLVQEMGLEVARKQSSKPGERIRLCDAQEIHHVLRNNRASEEIQGIFLDMSEIDDVNLSPDVFKETYNLRLLKIIKRGYNKNGKLHLPKGLHSLPDSLKYLHWDDYPLKSLPSKLFPEKLVEIIIKSRKVEQPWHGVQNLANLRRVDLSHSTYLTEIPDLSQAPNLEKINLDYCSRLIHVPSHKFRNLDKLSVLRMNGCKMLKDLPHTIESAEYLHLYGCIKLENIPHIKKENVLYLDLCRSSIKELPESIGRFNNLTDLLVEGCRDLKTLPSSICDLKLRGLDLRYCSSLEEIPELLPRTLTKLIVDGTAIEKVPASSIEHLSWLRHFSLRYCERLRSLPTSLCKLKFLEHLNLCGCSRFEDFPEILEPMEHMRYLYLSDTLIRTLPLSIHNLRGLRTLDLASCKRVKFEVGGNIECFNQRGELEKLAPLVLDNRLDGIQSLNSLHLSEQNCDEILTGIAMLSRLKSLYISEWKNLRSLPELPLDLDILDAEGCSSLESVSSSRNALIKGVQTWNRYPTESRVCFFNCLKMDQNSRDNIVADGKLRFLRNAMYARNPRFKYEEGYYDSYICYPGYEIPEWYPHQATGSSIAIKLPANWWNDELLGFSLCLVTTFEDYNVDVGDLQFGIESYLMENSGERSTFNYPSRSMCAFRKHGDRFTSSDHVFMWIEFRNTSESYKAA